jgi:hypothetical protein
MEVTYQPYAECVKEECGWHAPTSLATRDQAKGHVRATGHEVRVVIEKVALWDRTVMVNEARRVARHVDRRD